MQKQLQNKREIFRQEIRRRFNNDLFQNKRIQFFKHMLDPNNSNFAKLQQSLRVYRFHQIDDVNRLLSLIEEPQVFKNIAPQMVFNTIKQCLKIFLKQFSTSRKDISMIGLIGVSNLVCDQNYKSQQFSTFVIQTIMFYKRMRSVDFEENQEIQWIYCTILRHPYHFLTMQHLNQLISTLLSDFEKQKNCQLTLNILSVINSMIKNKKFVQEFRQYLIPFLIDCTLILNQQLIQMTMQALKTINNLIRPYFSMLQKKQIQRIVNKLIDLNQRIVNENTKMCIWKILKIIVQESNEYLYFILKNIQNQIYISLSRESSKIKLLILDLFVSIFQKETETAKISLKNIGFYTILLRLLETNHNQINFGSLKILRLSFENLTKENLIECMPYLESICFKEIITRISNSKNNNYIRYECLSILEIMDRKLYDYKGF